MVIPLLGLLLFTSPVRAAAAPDARTDETTQTADDAAAAKQAKPVPPCSVEVDSYSVTGKEFSATTLSRFDGDKELFDKAKDAAERAHKLARNELERCAADAAAKAVICARELKALAKAEADYNDPGLQDTDGELTRKTHAAAKDLEACLVGGGISLPKGFVDKNRDRFTKTISADVVK